MDATRSGGMIPSHDQWPRFRTAQPAPRKRPSTLPGASHSGLEAGPPAIWDLLAASCRTALVIFWNTRIPTGFPKSQRERTPAGRRGLPQFERSALHLAYLRDGLPSSEGSRAFPLDCETLSCAKAETNQRLGPAPGLEAMRLGFLTPKAKG